jgi:putative aldouronate transport system permease protein
MSTFPALPVKKVPTKVPVRAKKRQPRLDLTRLLIHFAFVLMSAAFVSPLLLVLSASFTDENSLITHGYGLIPAKFSAFAYQYILQDPAQLIQSYGVSIFVTVVGSLVSVFVMALLAYPISRPDFRLRKPLSFYVFFTMLFNAGIVPLYIFVTDYLHLQDTLIILILPYLVVPWFVLLLRTFFSRLPQELLEAARIDGAGEWRTFFQIVLPLSTPSLATVGLFSMLLYWNDWWLSLLFIDNSKLFPLQYLLYRLITNIDAIAASSQMGGVQLPTDSVRMAMAILAIGPIVFAFAFIQRYFISGITLGGVKGD